MAEINNGRKHGHTGCSIFPANSRMGRTAASYFPIGDINEAAYFLTDEALSLRLTMICRAYLSFS
ncbi:DUF1810 family protein [Mucilaginibacter sp. SD-g]|uniref:DUF1810 family protein n=1 Tax=Mucilaginibacter segetis TaxID=2793071 RepID=A0A934UM36_9SPHI|nr:DUF1810 family protein [Mucilaginibacter segetis]